ncbi:MAG: hypothetical protein OXH85_00945 [Truepera sp.]|nr:hypothetical protein [Truepera sp.]
MSFHLLVAAPGSGKTTRLLARARDLADLGRRVWWVGLPNQRSYLSPGVITALIEAGADGTIRDGVGHTPWDYAKSRAGLRGKDIYWRLNEARFE